MKTSENLSDALEMKLEADDKCNSPCQMRCEYWCPAGCPKPTWGVGRPSCHPSCCDTMPLKLQTACLIFLLKVLSSALGRGPHHPHGQTPVEQVHHHYKPRGSESLTGDAQLLQDTKHIEEDSKVLTAEMLSNMTPEELEFHYFSAHDFDRNSKLDGLELLKAVYHTLDHEIHGPDEDVSIEPEANDLSFYIDLVDRTLDSDDKDGDGYVCYAEYRAARVNSLTDRTRRVLAEHVP